MAAAPPLRDRLSFLHRLPILLKGTSDDDVPCPGYLFEEIAKISHESPGSSQCLLEYLLSRLHSSSGHGKLKVLKILLYLCGHGSSSFLLILKRNSAFIQEAAAFAGPPDPLHGNSLYQKVRAAAQDLGSTLFSDTVLPLAPSQPLGNPPATGMGSQARPHGTLQGFGYSKEHGRTAMRHQPGQAGGGWDELDSSPSSQNSSQNSDLSRVSDSGSHSGSDSHSGASREPGDLAERVEVVALSDCQQELSLVRTVTRGPCAFLSREEAQHFLKACGLLNCEAVLQLLTCHLRGTKGPVCHCLPGERRPPSPGAHPPPHPAAAAGAQHGQPGTCDQQGHQAPQHSRDTGLYLFLEAPKLLCLNVPALVSRLTPTSSRKPSLTAHAVCHPWPSSCSAPEGRSGSIDLCALEHSELPGGCWSHTGRPLSAARPWHPPSACGHPQFLSSCFLPGCWKHRTSVTHPQVVLI
ncbi:AP-4 complex accessory subunit tepsin isoform X22 [Macaca fascicularis]|uniref:AP-4 complex accessory subunit tepsin isoform X22 n=1 Tax=Macaca fascicularis TaxID=9541 RepID=UPI003D15C21B